MTTHPVRISIEAVLTRTLEHNSCTSLAIQLKEIQVSLDVVFYLLKRFNIGELKDVEKSVENIVRIVRYIVLL